MRSRTPFSDKSLMVVAHYEAAICGVHPQATPGELRPFRI